MYLHTKSQRTIIGYIKKSSSRTKQNKSFGHQIRAYQFQGIEVRTVAANGKKEKKTKQTKTATGKVIKHEKTIRKKSGNN